MARPSKVHTVTAPASEMATQPPTEVAVDWAVHEPEIIKYYVDQNHNVAETQAYMLKYFGVNAT